MNKIHTELNLKIFENLNCKDKLNICQSNKNMFNICKNDKQMSRDLALCYFGQKLSNKFRKLDPIYNNLDEDPIYSLKDVANSYIGDDLTKKDIIYLFKNKDVVYKVILDFFPEYFIILSEEYPVNYKYKFQEEMGEYISENWYIYKDKIDLDALLFLIFYFLKKFDINKVKNIKQYVMDKDSDILQNIKDDGIDWFNSGKENSAQKQFFNYLIT